jgi:hypothetical protein
MTQAASVATMEREMGNPPRLIRTPDVCYLFPARDAERLPGVVDRWASYGIAAQVVLIPLTGGSRPALVIPHHHPAHGKQAMIRERLRPGWSARPVHAWRDRPQERHACVQPQTTSTRGATRPHPPHPMHRWQTVLWMPRARRRPPLKRLNDDLSARDELDAAPTGGRMNPMMARWGFGRIDDLTVEELAPLHQELNGWIRQRAPQIERTRRRASHGDHGRETT